MFAAQDQSPLPTAKLMLERMSGAWDLAKKLVQKAKGSIITNTVKVQPYVQVTECFVYAS